MKKIVNFFKNWRRKWGKWFWVTLIVLVLASGWFFLGRKSKEDASFFTVQKGEVRQELVLSGQIKVDKYAKLAFPASGKIAWVGVKEGDWVKKGRALTSLNTTTLNAAYQQALNNYRNYQAAAQSTLDSVKDHASDETFAQKAVRTLAEVNRDNAFDAVTAAEYNLKNSTLFAPFDGLIASLPYPSPGVNVGFTDIQVEILDPASIYFDVQADQSEVTEIKEGQSVAIVLDSFKDIELSGKATYIGFTPVSGESGTVYKVRVTLDKGSLGDITPRVGMTGDAKFVLSRRENVLFAPPKHIHSDKDGKYVFLGKKKIKTRVETGATGEERVEITSGIAEGDVLYD